MRENTTRGVVMGAGIAPRILWGRFTPVNGADPTVTHGLGLTMTRTGEGAYLVTIDPALKPEAWAPFASYIENDTANFHQIRIDSMDQSAGTFVVTVKTNTIADLDSISAFTLDDMIDQLCILVVGNAA